MKKHGSNIEFAADRHAELSAAFRKAWQALDGARVPEIAQEAVKMPASRFWVSEERAQIVVSQMERGLDPLRAMRPTKARMYAEIYDRVKERRQRDPHSPMVDIVAQVIYQPAPEFYMTAAHAIYLLCMGRKERRSRGRGR